MRTFIAKALFLAACLIAPATMLAQDSSSMTGTVTDVTGAVVPGTMVTLTNTLTGSTYKQTTDARGSYRFANVSPSRGYKASFSHQGFSTTEVSDITLNVAITRTQDAKLIAGNREAVTVSAGNTEVTLNTTDASIGNNISVEDLNDLPVYDRTGGISTLFYLQPGVDLTSGAVTGARIDQSSVTVDGMDANDIAAGTTFAIIPPAPVDSVEQFTGTVGGLVSSLGTGNGGQFQLVTKNGTNKFHGNINEYHRDVSTVANTWFNNLDGIARSPYIQNQFGGNIGGPILKDKLFFFFNFNDSRIIQSSVGEPTVPLDSFRNGTLNYINTSSANCDGSSRLTTAASCITNLSGTQVAQLDPSGIGFNTPELAFINARYPHANDFSVGDGVNTGGYRFTYPTPTFDTTYVGRIDYNVSKNHKIFGRLTIDRENATESLPEFPSDPSTHPFIDRSYGYVVSDVWTIGSNKVNQIYYGDSISKFSFPDLYNPTGANQYSFSGVSGPYTSFDGQKRRVPIPVVRDDFNWQVKSHSLQMGGQFKFIKTNSNLINNFNFVGVGLQGSVLAGGLNTTGTEPSLRPGDINQASSALNGYDQLFATALGPIGVINTNYDYSSAGAPLAAGSGSPRAYRFYQTEGYAGDTWKVTKKLTLSYGVRYQFYSVPYETHGEESITTQIPFNTYLNDRITQQNSGNTSYGGLPFYSNVLGGKANNGPRFYNPSYKDFGPRVAFAYNAYPKTVFNASAGIVYDRTVINAINFLQDQISYLFSNQQTAEYGQSDPYTSLLPYSQGGDYRVGLGAAQTNPTGGATASLDYPSTLNPAPAPITVPYTPYVFQGIGYGAALGQINFVIDPKLKDPYSIALNAGVEQELPWHMVMKLNYAGRLGRRLVADADPGQVTNVPDYTGGSTQNLSQAFAGLTAQMRINPNAASYTAQPWFEDVLAPGTGVQNGFANNTSLVAAIIGQLGVRGDIADSIQSLTYQSSPFFGNFPGFLPNNIGSSSQFSSVTYLTNMGNSNYHALLLTVDKNMSNGLKFEFNYSFSHSIDNTSLSANNNALFSGTGLICDVTRSRACRGNSDFDVTQEINSNFKYALPVGRGKEFLGNAPLWLEEAVGGWSLSGITYYRTGVAQTPYSDAYLASFENQDPAIFIGNKGDLKTKVNVDHSSNTVYQFAGGLAGANKVFNEFRGPLGLEYGSRNLVRSPGYFDLDLGLGKSFPLYLDKVYLKFRADAFNVFNHPSFNGGSLNIVGNQSNYGQITSTATGPSSPLSSAGARVAQFSARIEF